MKTRVSLRYFLSYASVNFARFVKFPLLGKFPERVFHTHPKTQLGLPCVYLVLAICLHLS